MEIPDYQQAIRFLIRSIISDTPGDTTSDFFENYSRLGNCYENLNEYHNAQNYYLESLNLANSSGDSNEISTAYNNLGNVYAVRGDYEKALDYYLKSLTIEENRKDSSGLAVMYNNIGIVYHDWKQLDKALEYYNRGFEYERLLNNKHGMASSLNNIAIVYNERNKLDTALALYRRSLQLELKTGNKFGIAVSMGNIGEFMTEAGNYDEAMNYLSQALSIYEEIENPSGIALTYQQIGEAYSMQRQYRKAITYYNKSMEIVEKLKIVETINENYRHLAALYGETRNFQLAYLYLQKYNHLKDSIFNQRVSAKMTAIQYDFELERRVNQIEILNKEKNFSDLMLTQQKKRTRLILIIALIAVMALIVITVISIMLIIQSRQKARANRLLQFQTNELIQQGRELLIAKNKAQESDRLKTVFLENMSHEIKTPMNGIIGFSDLLLNENLSQEERKKYLEIIRSNSKQLHLIMSDILEISLIDSGQIKIVRRIVDVNKLLNDIYTFHRAIALKDSPDVELLYNDGESGTVVKLNTDGQRLRQVLNNLISNAVKFTRKGSVKFGYRVLEKEIEFYVQDTGIGIAKEDQQFIFDRFRQVVDARRLKFGGTGLGLAISRNLVRILGGDIRVESKQGEGSIFSFTIPVEAQESEQLSKEMQTDELYDPDALQDLNAKSLMVLEGDAHDVESISEALRGSNCKLIRPGSIDDCLSELEHFRPDLLVVDLDALDNRVSGFFDRLRAEADGLKIICISSYSNLELYKKQIQEYCLDYLLRPLSVNELVSVVRSHLQE